MASRWMQAKRAIMARNIIKPTDPNARPPERPRAGHTIERSNHLSQEVAALAANYTGVVTVCDKGKPLIAQGKGKRQVDAPAKLDQYKGGGSKYEPKRKRPDDLVAPLRGAMVCCAWNETARFTLVKRQDR